MLLVGGTTSAQTIAKPDQRAAKTAAAKPAQPAKPAAAPAKAAEQGTDYWAINTDIGRYRDEKPIPAPDAPGRVRLQGAPGSVGFASGAVRTGQFADPQSYAGVSLSLTNSNKSFPLPTQLLPHNQW
jgi:hypothetical protein